MKLLIGRIPAPNALDMGTLSPPNSRLAREAEQACAEQPPSIVAHAYRTWAFARALSVLDGVPIDVELLYVGTLLHDTGLVHPSSFQDFTLRSAQRATACLKAAGRMNGQLELEDSLTAHTTPGATVKRDGALAAYIQAGSMVDLIGLRRWDLPGQIIHQTVREHPRPGFTADIVRLLRAEARAVPGGRFSLIRRCGFGIAVRVTTLK